LGRLPLWTRVHISNTSENTLVHKRSATIHINCWTKNIFSIIDNLGFSFIILKKLNKIMHFWGNIKQRITDQCLQEESAKIHNSFYHVIFDDFKRCAYTDINILIKKAKRSVMSSMRLRAHNLSIKKRKTHVNTTT
jgi:hypothetical protein